MYNIYTVVFVKLNSAGLGRLPPASAGLVVVVIVVVFVVVVVVVVAVAVVVVLFFLGHLTTVSVTITPKNHRANANSCCFRYVRGQECVGYCPIASSEMLVHNSNNLAEVLRMHPGQKFVKPRESHELHNLVAKSQTGHWIEVSESPAMSVFSRF